MRKREQLGSGDSMPKQLDDNSRIEGKQNDSIGIKMSEQLGGEEKMPDQVGDRNAKLLQSDRPFFRTLQSK